MVSRHADLGGPVHYADFGGPGGSGPPLVLIHGLALSHASWISLAPALARRRRVYALDFVGHGHTPLAGRRANLAGHLDLIHRFLHDVVGEPAVLMGHSTGGHLSLLEAAQAPDHVAGLVLVDAAVPVPAASLKVAVAQLARVPLMSPVLMDLAVMLGGRRSPESVARLLLRFCTPRVDLISEEAISAMTEIEAARRGRWEAVRAFTMTTRSLTYWNLRKKRFYEMLERIQAPALIVQGPIDPLVPRWAAYELHRRRPDWDLALFPRIGHAPMLECPEDFLEVVETWAAAQAPAGSAARPSSPLS